MSSSTPSIMSFPGPISADPDRSRFFSKHGVQPWNVTVQQGSPDNLSTPARLLLDRILERLPTAAPIAFGVGDDSQSFSVGIPATRKGAARYMAMFFKRLQFLYGCGDESARIHPEWVTVPITSTSRDGSTVFGPTVAIHEVASLVPPVMDGQPVVSVFRLGSNTSVESHSSRARREFRTYLGNVLGDLDCSPFEPEVIQHFKEALKPRTPTDLTSRFVLATVDTHAFTVEVGFSQADPDQEAVAIAYQTSDGPSPERITRLDCPRDERDKPLGVVTLQVFFHTDFSVAGHGVSAASSTSPIEDLLSSVRGLMQASLLDETAADDLLSLEESRPVSLLSAPVMAEKAELRKRASKALLILKGFIQTHDAPEFGIFKARTLETPPSVRDAAEAAAHNVHLTFIQSLVC